MPAEPRTPPERWPPLHYAEWRTTAETLQLWTQVVGKVRLANAPWQNHSWHVVLYVTPRGLSTGSVPAGERTFALEFDFLAHELVVATCDGEERRVALRPRSVAEFHAAVVRALRELGLPHRFHGRPNEVARAVPFAMDVEHASYDADAAQRFWRVLLQADRVLKAFRSGFLGKCSPVHFFWGSFDLAVTRFSGRRAPAHRGGIPNLPDAVVREAYSHEVCSAGFWPGGPGREEPLFYAYAYPAPAGFAAAAVRPAAASFDPALGEFVLPYEAVRASGDPDAALSQFLASTYAAAAELGGWDRAALEREPPARPGGDGPRAPGAPGPGGAARR